MTNAVNEQLLVAETNYQSIAEMNKTVLLLLTLFPLIDSGVPIEVVTRLLLESRNSIQMGTERNICRESDDKPIIRPKRTNKRVIVRVLNIDSNSQPKPNCDLIVALTKNGGKIRQMRVEPGQRKNLVEQVGDGADAMSFTCVHQDQGDVNCDYRFAVFEV